MTGAVWSDTKKMTVEGCVTYCTDNSFRYAGLEGGSTCRCDNVYQGMGQAATSTCQQQTCVGNAQQFCGSTNTILVYDVSKCTAQPACGVLGCVPSGSYWWGTGYSTPTHKPCQAYCQSQGYNFGGLSGTQWCYCANSYDTKSYVDSSKCNIKCTDGNPCGGDGYTTVLNAQRCSAYGTSPYAAAVKVFDWRTRGNVVTAVKDQGQCGDCWAHSGLAALESQWAIKTGQLLTLSPQQVIDCSGQECNGGWMTTVWDWAAKNGGIALSSSQPYTQKKAATCNADHTGGNLKMASPTSVGACNNYNETQLLAAVTNLGPVSVAINMGESTVSYSNGIYMDNWVPSDGTNHAVVIEGYGTDTVSGLDFWIVRNSWGTWWGEAGYFRVKRNTGTKGGTMGIVSGCIVPRVAP